MILFKGQKENSKEWVEGQLIITNSVSFIIHNPELFFYVSDYSHLGDISKEISFSSYYEVIPETVCQFVNLTDKDGVKIFSNDLRMDSDGVIFRIYSTFGGFVIKAHYWKKDISDLVSGDELIFDHLSNPQVADWVCNCTKHYGNIHDNK